MATDLDGLRERRFSLEEFIDMMNKRDGLIVVRGATPVGNERLEALEAAADCRLAVDELRTEMHGELDDIKDRLAAVEKGQETTQDLVRELPEKFMTAMLGDKADEREAKNENSKQRLELCRDIANKLLGSWIFMSLLGASLFAATAGVFLSSVDLQMGDWFDMSTNDRENMELTRPIADPSSTPLPEPER